LRGPGIGWWKSGQLKRWRWSGGFWMHRRN